LLKSISAENSPEYPFHGRETVNNVYILIDQFYVVGPKIVFPFGCVQIWLLAIVKVQFWGFANVVIE